VHATNTHALHKHDDNRAEQAQGSKQPKLVVFLAYAYKQSVVK